MIALLLALTVQCPDGSPPPCRGTPRAAPTSVAVLYFENASADTADAYLADGITEEIISRLGEVGRVQVKSRYLVRRYRGPTTLDPQTIGRQLAVASIVTGSVRRAGSRLRVTAEMVRAADGDVIWSERFDRADTDVLSLQEDLAREVATAITGRLLPAERQAIAARPTRNPEAWDHFLRGNAALTQRSSAGLAHALAEYQTAARLDPAFSRALARIAVVYALASWRSDQINGLPPDSAWRLARIAADRALRANNALSDSWLALGAVQLQRPESLVAARASMEHALTLDSASAEAWHAYGWVLVYQGQDAQGIAAWHHALALEPNRPITLAMMGLQDQIAHRWPEAERWFDSALALDPGFEQAQRIRALARLGRGDTTAARTGLRTGVGNAPVLVLGPALVSAVAGDSAPLRAEVARELALPADSLHDIRILNLAAGLIVLGDGERALDLLLRTRWKNTNFYQNMTIWPFETLRGRPRYEAMLDEYRVPAGPR